LFLIVYFAYSFLFYHQKTPPATMIKMRIIKIMNFLFIRNYLI